MLASLVGGALVAGVVALTSGRLAERVGLARHQRYWGEATAVFAASQAFADYAMTAAYAALGRYTPLSAVAAPVLLAVSAIARVAAPPA